MQIALNSTQLTPTHPLIVETHPGMSFHKGSPKEGPSTTVVWPLCVQISARRFHPLRTLHCVAQIQKV
jgi:hypothetical protein